MRKIRECDVKSGTRDATYSAAVPLRLCVNEKWTQLIWRTSFPARFTLRAKSDAAPR